MKIYIVGTGGVGGYLGGVLAKSGNDVTFLVRGDSAKAIRENGLKINSVKSGNFVIKPAKVVTSISQIKDPDAIFFLVKTYDTETVSKELAKVVNDQTVIISFQNGIQNDLEIKRFADTKNVYPGVVYIFSTKGEPGVINQIGGLCKFIFGDRKGHQIEVLKTIQTVIQNSGLEAVYTKDIVSDMWQKFILMNAMAGITALSRSTVGTVMEDPYLRQVYESCIHECITVANKEGVKLPADTFDSAMKFTQATNPGAKSSMLVDLENGRRLELETFTGNLIRLARKHKIPVPISETIYAALRPHMGGKLY